MKILLCHNFYQQPGGEDQVFADEGRLLESHGHTVVRYTRHNDEVQPMSRLAVAQQTIWSRQTSSDLAKLIDRESPDVLHCHNTFPLISPASYYAARKRGLAVIQTLHNYRVLCPGATFLRQGKVCEKCRDRFVPWPAVMHGCYRSNRMATAVVAGMLTSHRLKNTWSNAIDRYIVQTEFARQKFIEGGLPANKMCIKPNFVDPDPKLETDRGDYAVFVGRLSPEKGIETLLAAWPRLARPLPLKIVGDGPLGELVHKAADKSDLIEWLGYKPPNETLKIVGKAAFMVMPSIWYEMFPLTILEAYAKGTPVIASRLGSLGEMIDDGRTGLHFVPGDPNDLAAKVQQLSDDHAAQARMQRACRNEYKTKYTAERNHSQLLEVYQEALENVAFEAHGPTSPKRQSIPTRMKKSAYEGPVVGAPQKFSWPRKVELFGVQVSPTTYDEASSTIMQAAQEGIAGVVSCHAVHALITSSCDPSLREKVNAFDMVTPDGQPVRWALNLLHRTRLSDRVYGPELMLRLCAKASEEGVSIYLYGGNPSTLAKLHDNLLQKYPRLKIAGCESPPFRALTSEEDEAAVDRINSSSAGLILIGLGCPKQDIFAYEHRTRLHGVQICVGAAFDFHAGAKRVAPAWMQRRGLEWLFRLVQEPRRLWRRYLVTNSLFLGKLALALCRGRGRAAPHEWAGERVL